MASVAESDFHNAVHFLVTDFYENITNFRLFSPVVHWCAAGEYWTLRGIMINSICIEMVSGQVRWLEMSSFSYPNWNKS